MIKKLLLALIFTLSISNLTSAQVLKNKETESQIHFSIADKIPFQNNCDNIPKGEEKTICLEDALRNQILKLIGNEIEYEGEMHLYFTVNKKGVIEDIATKGYPSDPKLELKIREAITKLEIKKGKFRGKIVNVRCYTRVFPVKI